MTSSDPASLSKRLREWDPQAAFDPAFSAQVWARIAGARTPSAAWSFRLTAGTCLLAALLLGISGGLRANHRQFTDLAAAHYAQSIDPLLLTGLAPAAHSHP